MNNEENERTYEVSRVALLCPRCRAEIHVSDGKSPSITSTAEGVQMVLRAHKKHCKRRLY